MKLLLCASYLSIPVTLNQIEAEPDHVAIATPLPEIGRIFSRVLPPERIFVFRHPGRELFQLNPVKLVYSLAIILLRKREARTQFQAIRQYSVHFFDLAWHCEFELWLVKHLSRTNAIVWSPIVALPSSVRWVLGWRKSLMRLLNHVVYGTATLPCYATSFPTSCITPAFVTQVAAVEKKIEPDLVRASRYLAQRTSEDWVGGSVLVLAGGVVGFLANETDYVDLMDSLLNELAATFGEKKLRIKPHPRNNDLHGSETKFQVIPKEIPAFLTFGDVECVVGASSFVLVEAALAGKKSISTLKMLAPIDRGLVDEHIAYLEMNAPGLIVFPDDLDGFCRALSK